MKKMIWMLCCFAWGCGTPQEEQETFALDPTQTEFLEIKVSGILAPTLSIVGDFVPHGELELVRDEQGDFKAEVTDVPYGTHTLRLVGVEDYTSKIGDVTTVKINGHLQCQVVGGKLEFNVPVSEQADCQEQEVKFAPLPKWQCQGACLTSWEERFPPLSKTSFDNIMADKGSVNLSSIDVECFGVDKNGQPNPNVDGCANRAHQLAEVGMTNLVYMIIQSIFDIQPSGSLSKRWIQKTLFDQLNGLNEVYFARTLEGQKASIWPNPLMWLMDMSSYALPGADGRIWGEFAIDHYLSALHSAISRGDVGGIVFDQLDPYASWYRFAFGFELDVDRDGVGDDYGLQNLSWQIGQKALYRYYRKALKKMYGSDFIIGGRTIHAFWGGPDPIIDLVDWEAINELGVNYGCGQFTGACVAEQAAIMGEAYSIVRLNITDPNISDSSWETALALCDFVGPNCLASVDRSLSQHGEYKAPAAGVAMDKKGQCQIFHAYQLVDREQNILLKEGDVFNLQLKAGQRVRWGFRYSGFDQNSKVFVSGMDEASGIEWNWGDNGQFVAQTDSSFRIKYFGPGELRIPWLEVRDPAQGLGYFKAECGNRISVFHPGFPVTTPVTLTFNGQAKTIAPQQGAIFWQ